MNRMISSKKRATAKLVNASSAKTLRDRDLSPNEFIQNNLITTQQAAKNISQSVND
jgi:hypothetical protein